MTISKLAALAAVAVIGVSLSGCIMYIAPHDGDWPHHHHHDDDKPAPDEKPADTLPSAPAQ